MVRFWVSLEVLKARLRRLREERGAIDDLLMRGLFVVAVLGVAAGVIAYFGGLNSWIGNKLQGFMESH